jgi:hypothetical protein
MKSRFIWLLTITVLFFTGTAWSSVTGTWTVAGTETMTLSGLGRDKVHVRDRFTFEEDGSFSSLEGTWAYSWSQTGRKFNVALDADLIQEHIMHALGPYSSSAIVELTFASLAGTESKNGKKITGTLKLKGNLSIYANGKHINSRITMVYNFAGKRDLRGQAKTLDSPVSEALLHTIASDLLETAGIDFEFR